jgi:hypothetical protein
MEILSNTTPTLWALMILGSATLFTVAWSWDAITHKKLAELDITDQEFQTHRNILVASMIMELSLVGMFWNPIIMLPIFIASFLTRLVHEFMDELKFHADRCTPHESRLHLVMWISVLTKAGAMFLWGFFTSYEGIESLPFALYAWGILILIVMAYVSYVEWRR